jgi:hypothetical protein
MTEGRWWKEDDGRKEERCRKGERKVVTEGRKVPEGTKEDDNRMKAGRETERRKEGRNKRTAWGLRCRSACGSPYCRKEGRKE